MPTEVLLRNGYIVTMDESRGDIAGADVLLRDDKIAEIGRGLSASHPNAEVIDVTGRLVLPGLVDTHRHVWQGAIGGYTPQITGAGYGPAVLTGIPLKHSPDDV